MNRRILSLALTAVLLICTVNISGIKPALAAQNSPAPTISIVDPTNDTHYNVSITGVPFELKYETNDTLSWAGYNIDGRANLTLSGNRTTDAREFYESGYQFENSGYHTLTLYANDTRGNWATPQKVNYFVTVYPDSTSKPNSSSATDALIPLATVAVIVIGVLAVVIAALSFYRRHRKTTSNKPD